MRTRNPAASTDIGSVIQSETAWHRYIAVQVATTRQMTSRAVRVCAPISVPGTPWFQKASGPFAALPHPTPAEMNPPANRLTHRHRPAAAGAEITLVGRRRGEFARRKITVNYPVIGVARHATADCTLRTDDLLAFVRNHHVTGSLLHAFRAREQTECSRAASLFAAATYRSS